MKCLFINIEKNIKWIFLSFFVFHFSLSDAQAPNISRIEYYIDNDPGYGNATNVSFSGTNNITTPISINIASLLSGVHVVGVRSRDANGAWSLDNKWLFLKPYPSSVIVQPNINRVEWYLDNDPGYGKGTPITITAGQQLTGLAVNISLSSLGPGIHVFGIRSQDANGAWSLDNKWLFIKPYPNSGVTVQPNITRVEWYLDNDPGYGKGTPITITAGQQLSGLAINIGLASLNSGVHIVAIRSQDANGSWSIDNKWLFIKPYSNANGTAQPNITKMEYYIDDDPGYGKASNITITAGPNLSAVVFSANLTNVPNGSHKLGIRSQDANGAWSIDNQFDFTGGLAPAATTWIGITSTDWNTASNWSYDKVPDTTVSIVIPSGTPYAPILSSGETGYCKGILVKTGATVTVLLGAALKVEQ